MQAQAMTQDDFDLAKFIKLMKMTTATVDGEALNAIRMANRMLTTNKLDWEFLRTKITIIADPFTSISEPPKPTAAPPPAPPRPTYTPQPTYTPPPPRPPPRPMVYDTNTVNTYFSIINRSLSSLDQGEQQTLHRIAAEWARLVGRLLNIDYDWLENMARELELHPRDVFQVQQFFDVLDLAPLSQPDVARLRRVKGAWVRQNDRLHNRDFRWLELNHLRHKPRATAKGKAKRVF